MEPLISVAQTTVCVSGTDVSDVLQKLATLFLSQGPNELNRSLVLRARGDR